MKTFLSFLSLLCLAGLLFPGTAVSATGEADFGRQVLAQLNRVREDPSGYAEYLSSLRSRYSADGLVTRPGETTIRSKEGLSALEDAIRALRHAQPVDPLADCEPLARAAQEYAAEQSRTGGVGHGADLFGRFSRHGAWLETAGENISYGSTTPERVVADLIIDDGQRSRGHRANILNHAFRVAGIGVNRHPKYGVVCVIDFAGGFQGR